MMTLEINSNRLTIKRKKTHELLLDLKDHVVSLGGIPGRSIKLCN